jgi:hypothetical protein
MCWDIISNSDDNAVIASVAEADWARISGTSILQQKIYRQQTNYHTAAGQCEPHLLLWKNVSFKPNETCADISGLFQPPVYTNMIHPHVRNQKR